MRDGAPVVESLGELERALDVLARGLEVALAAVAAGAPAEDVRAQQVARHPRALGERQRLVEEADRRGDALKLVAADAEPEEHVRPVEIREARCLRQLAGAVEQLARLAELALLHAGPRLAAERPNLELRRRDALDGRRDLLVLDERLVVAVILGERLRAREHRLDATALVRRDPVREEAGVDAQAGGEPLDRLLGRARLAALDLADVLLREAVAGEIGLRHPRRHAQLAHALAELQAGAARCGAGGGGEVCGAGHGGLLACA